MHPTHFSWQLAVILEEHPNPLLLQHPWVPALPEEQLSFIPRHQCQASLELFSGEVAARTGLQVFQGPGFCIPIPSHWAHPCLTSL